MMEKVGNWIFPLKSGYGIGYSIARKYRPIWVSVSVSDLNQNSGFRRTLNETKYFLPLPYSSVPNRPVYMIINLGVKIPPT